MTRFFLATALVAALGPVAAAQQAAPVAPQPPTPASVPAAPALPPVAVQLPQSPPPFGPPITYQKSGGILVGPYGIYPYDTGWWLLGDTQGTTRQSGSFTMVYPDVPYAPPAPSAKHQWLKRGIFHK